MMMMMMMTKMTKTTTTAKRKRLNQLKRQRHLDPSTAILSNNNNPYNNGLDRSTTLRKTILRRLQQVKRRLLRR